MSAEADIYPLNAPEKADKDRLFDMALLEHRFVTLGSAIAMVDRMPLGHEERRQLAVRIRRWAKTLLEHGVDVADE